MNDDQFDAALRDRSARPSPSADLTARIMEASAQIPSHSASQSRSIWIGALSLAAAAAVIALLILPSGKPVSSDVTSAETSTVIESPEPARPSYPTPYHRELDLLERDARRTLAFLSERLPSLPETF